MLQVERLTVGDMQMNCYIVSEPESNEAVIVDPGAEAGRIAAALGARKPVAVLLTHGHFDHMGAADELCERYGIPLYVHEADADKLKDPLLNVSELFGRRLVVRAEPRLLTDGQRIKVGCEELTVLHTPGHSNGSCCFMLPHNAGVLCGDTLFNGGYGRTDFEDGDLVKLKNSLRVLLLHIPKMPAYPGHGDMAVAGRNEADV